MARIRPTDPRVIALRKKYFDLVNAQARAIAWEYGAGIRFLRDEARTECWCLNFAWIPAIRCGIGSEDEIDLTELDHLWDASHLEIALHANKASNDKEVLDKQITALLEPLGLPFPVGTVVTVHNLGFESGYRQAVWNGMHWTVISADSIRHGCSAADP